MIINHNIAALNTLNRLNIATGAQSKSMEKLASGLRINRAGDDAAGLAISEKMRAQIRGLDQATRNAQDGISLIQTAEGALNETHSILQRMRELAVQAANDTNTDADRNEIQKEINQLVSEIDRIGNNTEFNTKKLLNGDLDVTFTKAGTNTDKLMTVTTDDASFVNGTQFKVTQTLTYADESSTGLNDGAFQQIDIKLYDAAGTTSLGTVSFTKAELDAGTTTKDLTLSTGQKITIGVDETVSSTTGNGLGTESSQDTLTVSNDALTFQIGANEDQNLKLALKDMRATALGVNAIDVTTQSGANSAVTTINNAIEKVSAERAKFGAYQNRLEHTINNLGTSSENLTAAESRIRDVDMAKEVMEQTKSSILAQAAQAMLAQANQQPQGVLQLLR
ncbi:flagellin [Bacillus smithii]|uniref:flagellin N-terminal helical domain-containing protein n=1 Tax=Bacillus smithii TaxID=1479 RepID=UPI002E20DE1B|nr:flagellin [Bacillus smithii]